MKWCRVSGFAGPTYFSEDGQWTILAVKSGEHRLCREQHCVGEFPTLRLAQQAAEQATELVSQRPRAAGPGPDHRLGVVGLIAGKR